jgi:hypothetical protein
MKKGKGTVAFSHSTSPKSARPRNHDSQVMAKLCSFSPAAPSWNTYEQSILDLPPGLDVDGVEGLALDDSFINLFNPFISFYFGLDF